METKLSKLKAAAARGDWREALRIAARFPNLGTHKADVKRAHEAYENGEFYRQLGRDPAVLIEAGKAALIDRYNMTKDEDAAMTTTLTAMQIAALTAILTGETKRAANRDAAERRFRNVAAAAGMTADRIDAALTVAEFYDAERYIRRHVEDDALAAAHAAQEAGEAPTANATGDLMRSAANEPDFGSSPTEDEAAAGEAEAARNCPPPVAGTVEPADDGIEIPAFLRRDRPTDAAQAEPQAVRIEDLTPENCPTVAANVASWDAIPSVARAGKRAGARSTAWKDREAVANRGELPVASDFSAPSHARYRKRLAELVALAQAGDVAGLEAVRINPISSSPIAMAKYRDLCVRALRPRAGLPVAA